MPALFARLKDVFAPLWRVHPPLATTALLMAALLPVFVFGLWLDPREVSGAPAWMKPAKFAASITVYCLTLLWIFRHIPDHAKTRALVGWTTTVAMLIELSIIAGQAARGRSSHFNVATPLDAALWLVMGAAISVQTLSTLAVAVALFRQRFADAALGWALRLGLLITILGAALGGVMAPPRSEQVEALRAGHGLVSGAHTVGGPDGGSGVPITGWSREHGDLRVAHFLGLHALQLLPLSALALRRTRASARRRARLVVALAGSYSGLVGIVLWQALRGQSLFALDAATLGVLLAWVCITGVLTWQVLSPINVRGRRPLASAQS